MWRLLRGGYESVQTDTTLEPDSAAGAANAATVGHVCLRNFPLGLFLLSLVGLAGIGVHITLEPLPSKHRPRGHIPQEGIAFPTDPVHVVGGGQATGTVMAHLAKGKPKKTTASVLSSLAPAKYVLAVADVPAVDVCIMNWARPLSILQAIEAMHGYEIVSQILVFHGRDDTRFTTELDDYPKVKHVDAVEENERVGLFLRYQKLFLLETGKVGPCVLFLDDDVMLTEQNVRALYMRWKGMPSVVHGCPDNIRMLSRDVSRGGERFCYTHSNAYNKTELKMRKEAGDLERFMMHHFLVLTSTAMIHRDVLEFVVAEGQKFHPFMRAMAEHGVVLWNGEDIFLGVVSAYFNLLREAPPELQWSREVRTGSYERCQVSVRIKHDPDKQKSVVELGHRDISTGKDHGHWRNMWTHLLIKHYTTKHLSTYLIAGSAKNCTDEQYGRYHNMLNYPVQEVLLDETFVARFASEEHWA